ncbi:MAG: hypothetical protein AB8U25_00275 [Rickettsiales endosymbiont of Dermacentor nuttalli]
MIRVDYLLNFSVYSYKKNLTKVPLPTNWQIYKDSSDYKYSETGYHGVSFINHKTREIVIASSGTSIGEHGIIDVINDIKKDYEILLGNIPMGFETQELHFARMVIESLKDYKHYNYYFTGHSYGAVVAEVNHFILSKELDIKSQAITFDSPGSTPIIASLDKKASFPLSDVTIYNSNPNIINTCNKQAGKTFLTVDKENYISLPKIMTIDEMTSSFVEFLKLTSSRHKLEKMQENIDNKTGDFIYKKEVTKWPVLVETIRVGLDKAINKLLETKDLSISARDDFVNTIDCFFDKTINNKCFKKLFDVAKKGFKILENILDISDTNYVMVQESVDAISYLGISKKHNDHDEL